MNHNTRFSIKKQMLGHVLRVLCTLAAKEWIYQTLHGKVSTGDFSSGQLRSSSSHGREAIGKIPRRGCDQETTDWRPFLNLLHLGWTSAPDTHCLIYEIGLLIHTLVVKTASQCFLFSTPGMVLQCRQAYLNKPPFSLRCIFCSLLCPSASCAVRLAELCSWREVCFHCHLEAASEGPAHLQPYQVGIRGIGGAGVGSSLVC